MHVLFAFAVLCQACGPNGCFPQQRGRQFFNPPPQQWTQPAVEPAKPSRPLMNGMIGAPPEGVIADKMPVPDPAKLNIMTNLPSFEGKELTQDDASRLIGGATLPDFTKSRWLTVVGTERECDAVLRKVGDRQRLVVKCYPPGSDLLKDLRSYRPLGFREDGHPSLCLQEPTNDKGKARVIATANGPAEADQLIGSLRERDQNFDETKTPGPGGGGTWLDDGTAKLAGLLLAAGFGLANPFRMPTVRLAGQ